MSSAMRKALAFGAFVSCVLLADHGLARESCDILVVGGGPAGIAAALQAGRSGASVVLVERGFQVGGNMTTGGVNFPGLFHAWGRQVIDGCAYEVLTNAVALSGERLPDFSAKPARHWMHQLRVDIPVYVAVAEEALGKAGVSLRYHAAPTSARRQGERWLVELAADGVVSEIQANVLVDCTGDGTLAAVAGASRLREKECAPGSFMYTVANGRELWERCDKAALERAYRAALAAGELKKGDTTAGMRGLFERVPGTSWNYVADADTSTAEKRTDANLRARASLLRMYRFLKRQPGFEALKLGPVSPEVGVRETWRVEGEYVMTVDDYVSGRKFEDGVCHAFYPVDLHSASDGVDPKQLKEGVVPSVPLRALCAKDVPNVLMAGRCVSGDRLAVSALRVQASCMAMGQAAGEAAALAAARGCDVRCIPLDELCRRLSASGTVVPRRLPSEKNCLCRESELPPRCRKPVVGLPTVTRRIAPVRFVTNVANRVFMDFGRAAFGFLEVRAPASSTGGVSRVILGEMCLPGDRIRCSCDASIYVEESKVEIGPGARVYRAEVPSEPRNTDYGHVPPPVRIPDEYGVICPFRYVEIHELPFAPKPEDFTMVAVNYPMDMKASSFVSSDDGLNQVYGFSKYSILATSYAGLYVDGNRERIPYESDAYINQLGEYAVHDDPRLARATARHLMSYPTWPVEWAQHMIKIVWTDWMQTADRAVVREFYDRLKSEKLLLDKARAKDSLLEADYEWPAEPRAIVDWPETEQDGFAFRRVNAVVNAFHYANLLEMADLARAVGRTEDARLFTDRAQLVKKSFHDVFYNPETGLYRDGEGTDHSSLHANAAALAFGLVPARCRDRVADWCVSRGMACSVYFSQYLLEGLFRAGRDSAAIDLMRADTDRSWIGMMKQGSTITLEAWNREAKPNLDWNHAWGTVPLNIVSRYVLGVRPLEPGYAKVLVEPKTGGLKKVSGRVPTPAGTVGVEAEGRKLCVDVPCLARIVWRAKVHDVPPGRHCFAD